MTTTTRLQAALDEAAPRMAVIAASLYNEARKANPEAREIEGTYYVGGPVCLALVSADGKTLASVNKATWEMRPVWMK
jgi:hypothetical protein